MILFKFLLYLAFGFFVLLVFIYVFQRHLIYMPFSGNRSPESSGVPEMQVIDLLTQDGNPIKVWYRPPLKAHNPMVVHFHGNAGRISDRGFIMKPFLDEGYGVLLTTYRGYSDNPGKPSEEGLYQDGKAAMEYLKAKGIAPECVVIYGDSIGGAVAIQMATLYPIGALVLQAPFTSLSEIGQYHYPYLPVKWFLKDEYNSISKVKSIHIPVLVIHGEVDDIIPLQFGEKIFDAMNEPKQLLVIPDRGHNDLFEPGLILQFIKKTIDCKEDTQASPS